MGAHEAKTTPGAGEPPGTGGARVFISHASEDRAWAEGLCRAIEETGARCWIAPRDVPAGESYAEVIIAALDECRVLVLVFSGATAASSMVAREVERAASKGLALLPVRVSEGAAAPKSMELFLGSAQWIDATRPARQDRVADVVAAVSRALAAGATTEPVKREAPTPGHIGPYRLLSLIGEGGFGEVWLAERREPMVQRVAIKIIKPGMDSRAVIARFEQERQALAVMDHPNVAKVLDAGTTPAAMGGRPYFVMEHVKGEPITTFCDKHRLTIRQRLELFIPVCEAIQHAHHKGIIHRDIKPSNVLVSVVDTGSRESSGREAPGASGSAGSGIVGGAIVKVIDFGVAKAISQVMTDKTLFTEQGRMIGTPEYMSPEQAGGEADIDTRTDVYSLGVLLYELLTGVLPFDSDELRRKGNDEIRRIIREVDPPPPSTRVSGAGAKSDEQIDRACRERREAVHNDLRRDLDWVVLKALRKHRVERYNSALDLAVDVRRFLMHEPVAARAPSLLYKMGKFARRHRVAAALIGVGTVSVATVVMSLSIAVGLALVSFEEVHRNEAAAREAAEFFAHVLEAPWEERHGEERSLTRQEVLAYADAALATNPPEDAITRLTLHRLLARAYDRANDQTRTSPHRWAQLALVEQEHGADSAEHIAAMRELLVTIPADKPERDRRLLAARRCIDSWSNERGPWLTGWAAVELRWQYAQRLASIDRPAAIKQYEILARLASEQGLEKWERMFASVAEQLRAATPPHLFEDFSAAAFVSGAQEAIDWPEFPDYASHVGPTADDAIDHVEAVKNCARLETELQVLSGALPDTHPRVLRVLCWLARAGNATPGFEERSDRAFERVLAALPSISRADWLVVDSFVPKLAERLVGRGRGAELQKVLAAKWRELSGDQSHWSPTGLYRAAAVLLAAEGRVSEAEIWLMRSNFDVAQGSRFFHKADLPDDAQAYIEKHRSHAAEFWKGCGDAERERLWNSDAPVRSIVPDAFPLKDVLARIESPWPTDAGPKPAKASDSRR